MMNTLSRLLAPHLYTIRISLTVLLLTWIWWVGWRPKKEPVHYQRPILGLVLIQAITTCLFAFVLWFSVHHTTAPKVYFPPYSTYYFDKITQTIVPFLSGWVAALILGLGLWWVFVRRQHGVMLDHIDVMLLTLMSAAIGWPGVLPYLAILFLLAVLWMIVLVVTRKKTMTDRLVVTPVIIPAAVLTLIFEAQLLALTHLYKIRF